MWRSVAGNLQEETEATEVIKAFLMISEGKSCSGESPDWSVYEDTNQTKIPLECRQNASDTNERTNSFITATES